MAGPKALIVDHDHDLVKLLSAQLKAAGFLTVSASDGASAIMLAQRQKPNVIVLDLALPGGDGYLVMKRMKSLAPLAAIPIVIVTDKTLNAEEESRVRALAHSLHPKPVHFKELLGALRSAVGTSAGGGSA